MENQFIRHEPCFERILFVLTLDRKKMKERILIGEEQQIRFRLNGSQNAEVLCDMTRPLGTFLINFERDTDRDWNLDMPYIIGQHTTKCVNKMLNFAGRA